MSEYIPGTCNIGGAEVRQRRRAGYAGLGASVILVVALAALRAAPAWWLTLFVPASVSAGSFLQARHHFCAAYGMRGAFNFSDVLGRVQSVEAAEALAADRRRALSIAGEGALIGLAVALVGFAVGVALQG